jgi:hypothetical protein
MADGFLGRWAKRKEAVRKGVEVPDEPVKVAAPMPPPQPAPRGGGGEDKLPPPRVVGGGGGTLAEVQPPPTLDDVAALTPESDFSRFARADVPPDVRNAAMKKLFSDPHFNVMDGLDVYIDDYSKPDPMPAEMVRKLASSSFLKLFDEEEKPQEAESTTERGVSDVPPAQSVAQSGSGVAEAIPPAGHDADPDLRLQQDDAPGREEPGAGAR